MKYILTSILLIFAMTSFAEVEKKAVETITYKDGDVYTVGDNENVFVEQQENLYLYQPYQKTIQFKKMWPSKKVDKPEPVVNNSGAQPGSQEWCEAHDLHANGYTWDDQIWYRNCDTNDDNVYNICDWYEPTGAATFEEGQWEDVCNNGEPFNS